MKKFVIKKFEAKNSLFAVQGSNICEVDNSLANQKLFVNSGNYYKDNFIWFLGDEEDYLRARNWYMGKMKEDPNWSTEFYQKNLSRLEKFILDLDLNLQSVNKKEGDELIDFSRKFIKDASDTTGPAYFTDWVSYNAHEWLAQEYLGEITVDENDFRILTSPTEISFSQNFAYELAKIKLGKSSIPLEELEKKYFWVEDNYAELHRINLERIQQDFNNLTPNEAEKTISNVERAIPELKNKKMEIFQKLHLDSLSEDLFNTLANFVHLQDRRKAAVLVTNYILFNAYKKILKYLELENEEELILSAAYPDWIVNKSKEEFVELSKKSAQGSLKMVDKEVLFGEEAKNLFEEMAGLKQIQMQTIKGFVASQGQVSGTVKVINQIADFPKLNEGDILVASMTRPDMAPILKKAAAFVTDEGGITCHAAIVSRELNKPCIIGTKIATSVLKDGDQVEVDAFNGLVRIIKE